ncbi:MAG: glycosyltransferase family 4 protein [Armatimonadota bacterium]|nr:glycosyltransferase family 4 protein [Armatimonadota bacterium]
MKVLIYAHAFAPLTGGAETYVMHVARGLAAAVDTTGGVEAHAFEVTVATPTAAGDFDDAWLPFRLARRPSLRSLFALVRWADAVVLAGPAFLPLLLGLLARRPVLVEHHGYQAVCPNGLLFEEPRKSICPGHFMARRYHHCFRCVYTTSGPAVAALKLLVTFPRRWMLSRVAANLAVTRHVAGRIRLPKTQVVYHGVPIPEAAGDGMPEGTPTFAYLGRLVSEKGLHLLLEAARSLADQGMRFRVKFIGDGPERRRLEALTDTLGLRPMVCFTGFLHGSTLEEEMRGVTALVMPSVWEETAGLAAMEQMARGRLVIAADVGGLCEVVSDAGLKFRAGDAAALAACMRQVLQAPQLAGEIGPLGRERALRRFALERMVEDHRRIVAQVARGG